MDEDKEKEKREESNEAEKKKKPSFSVVCRELRAMLQSHGYPVKEDRSRMLENTAELSEESEEDEENSEGCQDKSDWIPSFRSYEEFVHTTLQSLDGFLIVLNTDGMIIYVAENISPLLGYLPAEVMGKKLLSFLPDEEKNEVFNHITFRLPLSESENHIEFCCHFKRGSSECRDRPTYKYAKFIMTIKDICHEPLVLFGGNSYRRLRAGYPATNLPLLPLEEQYYLIGTVSILRSEILWELCSGKDESQDVTVRENSDEEHESEDHGSSEDEGEDTRTEDEPADSPDEDVDVNVENNSAEIQHCGSHENIYEVVIKDEFETSGEANPPPTEGFPDFQVALCMGCSEVRRRMGQMGCVGPETLPFSSVVVSTSYQPPLPSPSLASYIEHRELQMIEKFEEQLEERTQILQSGIRSQQEALEVIKGQLQTIHNFKFQMQSSTSLQVDGSQLQASGMMPHEQPSTPTKRDQPDHMEDKYFCGSRAAHSFRILGEPCAAYPQEQQLQEQQLQEQQLQEQQQQQQAVLMGSQPVQICLPTHSDLPVAFFSNQIQVVEPILVPVQIVSEMEAENHGNEHDSFFPEGQQAPAMDLQSVACGPISEVTSSPGLDQSSLQSNSKLPILKDERDYIQLWQQPPDPQHYVYIKMNSCPDSGEAASEETVQPVPVLWHQMQVPEAAAQEHPDPEAFPAPTAELPDKMGIFPPGEQPEEDVGQQQYFHTQL